MSDRQHSGKPHRSSGPRRSGAASNRGGSQGSSSSSSSRSAGRHSSGSVHRAASGSSRRRRDPDPVRRTAFDVLVAVTARDAYANLLLPGLLRERRLTGRDAALATELTYGTLRARGTLDAIVAAASDRAADETDPRVRDLLRLGAYQLLYLRIPPHAAVSETVALAKVALTDGPARFANAVLRQVAERELAAWLEALAPDRDSDPVGYLEMHYSHPQWMIRAVSDALGDSGALTETEQALAANNARPEVHLAARPGRIERDELVTQASGEPGRFSPFAVRMTSGGDPGQLSAVRDGLAGVQDEGSQLVAWALSQVAVDGSDKNWLDMCAGPGGKAALLGALAEQRNAHLTAVEVGEKRAELVRTAVAGMPVTVLHTDATSVGEDPQLPADHFDRVLLDAPCTGLGALRRRPEARWRRQPSDIPPLTKLQRQLLTAAARAVRPGGVIGFATCSPHVAETRVQVAEAARKLGLELVDVRPYLPGVPDLGAGPSVQLWPHRHGTDAMFLAILRRV